MNEVVSIMTSHMIDMGLWKFWLLSVGLLITFFRNYFAEKRSNFNMIAALSSLVLFLITFTLTVVASF